MLLCASYLCVTAAMWYLAARAGIDDVAAFTILFGAATFATRFEVRVGNVTFSGDFIPLVACAIVSPALAPLCALPSLTMDYASRAGRVLSTLSVAFGVATAGTIAGAMGDPDGISATVLLVTATGFGFLLANVTTVVLFMVLLRRATFAEMASSALASIVSSAIFLMPVLAVVVWAWAEIGTVALGLIVVPMTVAQYFLALYHRKVQLTDELAEKAQVLARTNLQFAAAMVKALDARDAYTAGHSAAVAVYTRDIAKEMGFDEETVRVAHLAGLLHDIGKIGVPGRVLNKTAPLDDEEYELMKSHAAMGAEILGEVDLYSDVALLVRYHHERIDGRGYPDGISGDAIPAISRMISVADTYSAMTTDRPYREGMPTEKAMSILRECRGTQLDQDFTDAFLRILIVADEAYQRGKQTDFEVEVAKHQALSEVEAEAVRLTEPHPAGPKAPAAPEVPMLPAAVDGELVEVDLEREAA